MALKTSQQNHSHIMIPFSKFHHLYYFVHISSIKAGTEVVEDLSLRRIKRFFLILLSLERYRYSVGTLDIIKYESAEPQSSHDLIF